MTRLAKRLVKPTPDEQRAARIEQLTGERAYYEQLKLTQQVEAQTKQAEHNAFMQRVEVHREAAAASAKRGVQLTSEKTHLRDVWAQTRQEELQREAEAEAARIAALTPRELWMSTLNFQDQRKVEVWERVNRGQKYPVPGLD